MDERPRYRSHWIPRTRDGRVAVVVFVALFALCMPPVTHTLWNRTEPWILGVPFLYGILGLVYAALVGVLLWVWRRGL